jgi:hypothetical protein
MSATDFFLGLAVGVGILLLGIGLMFGSPSGPGILDSPYSAHVISPGIIEVTAIRDASEYQQVFLDVDGSTQLFPHYKEGEFAEVHLGPGTHRVQIIAVNGPGVLGKHTIIDMTVQGRAE